MSVFSNRGVTEQGNGSGALPKKMNIRGQNQCKTTHEVNPWVKVGSKLISLPSSSSALDIVNANKIDTIAAQTELSAL